MPKRAQGNENERILGLIKQWNQEHLDLFTLSPINENGEFFGVIRFYYQDDGAKVSTKCIRVSSTGSVRDVIDILVEKFRPDMRMLTPSSYSLYEVHVNGEERKLDDVQKPLHVQLEWGTEGREGRFLLKRDSDNNRSSNAISEPENPQFKRKLSKREKKEAKKKEKERLHNKENEADNLATKHYTELPEGSFTRSISNPEAVMKRQRQQKLEKKLALIHQEEGPHSAGTLKIYGEQLNSHVPYKTLLLSASDTTVHVLRETMAKYGLQKEDPTDFYLLQILIPHGTDYHGGQMGKEYALRDDECPLAIAMAHSPQDGTLVFAIRRKSVDQKMKAKTMRAVSHEDLRYGQDDKGEKPGSSKLPFLVELYPDGSQNLKAKRHRIPYDHTDIGSDPKVMSEQCIVIPDKSIEDRHCIITHSLNGIVTITPTNKLAEVFVNDTRITETVPISDGMIVGIGRHHLFRFRNMKQQKNQTPEPKPRNRSYSGGTLPTEMSGSLPRDLTRVLPRDSPASLSRDPSGSLPRDLQQPNVHETTFDVDGHVESNQFADIPPTQHPENRMSGYMPDQPPDITDALPVAMEFRDEVEDPLLMCMILDVNDGNLQFKLAPTYSTYMAVRYRLSTMYRPEMPAVDRAHNVKSLVGKVASLIQQTIQTHHENPSTMSFWMANSSELLHFFKQDHDVHPFTKEAQEALAECVQVSFHHLVRCLQYDFKMVMSAFVDPNDDVEKEDAGGFQDMQSKRKPYINDVLNTLSSAMHLLRRCRVNAALTIQLFSQLFHFINMWLFNTLVTQPQLRMCSYSWGVRLKRRLRRVEAWAEEQGLELAAECHLSRIIQAAHLLQAPKNNQEDIDNICSTCFKLNSVQFRVILENYVPEPNEPQIPSSLIAKIVNVASNMADAMLREDGREILLEEDADLQLPFLLPEDGYSAEAVSGVPKGLTEFLDPLVRNGLCRVLVQPSAQRDWTVYMRGTEDLRISESPRKGATPQSMDQSAEDIPGQMEVIKVTFNKVNNSMGLSIVAAKGENEKESGIYIKSVVPQGAADIDGRLKAGDQLIEVDGHNLIGISQESAADLMKRTGYTVTLNVGKQGAIYHGLAKLLSQPSPIMQRAHPGKPGPGPLQHMSSEEAPPPYKAEPSPYLPRHVPYNQQFSRDSALSSASPRNPSPRNISPPSSPANRFSPRIMGRDKLSTSTLQQARSSPALNTSIDDPSTDRLRATSTQNLPSTAVYSRQGAHPAINQQQPQYADSRSRSTSNLDGPERASPQYPPAQTRLSSSSSGINQPQSPFTPQTQVAAPPSQSPYLQQNQSPPTQSPYVSQNQQSAPSPYAAKNQQSAPSPYIAAQNQPSVQSLYSTQNQPPAQSPYATQNQPPTQSPYATQNQPPAQSPYMAQSQAPPVQSPYTPQSQQQSPYTAQSQQRDYNRPEMPVYREANKSTPRRDYENQLPQDPPKSVTLPRSEPPASRTWTPPKPVPPVAYSAVERLGVKRPSQNSSPATTPQRSETRPKSTYDPQQPRFDIQKSRPKSDEIDTSKVREWQERNNLVDPRNSQQYSPEGPRSPKYPENDFPDRNFQANEPQFQQNDRYPVNQPPFATSEPNYPQKAEPQFRVNDPQYPTDKINYRSPPSSQNNFYENMPPGIKTEPNFSGPGPRSPNYANQETMDKQMELDQRSPQGPDNPRLYVVKDNRNLQDLRNRFPPNSSLNDSIVDTKPIPSNAPTSRASQEFYPPQSQPGYPIPHQQQQPVYYNEPINTQVPMGQGFEKTRSPQEEIAPPLPPPPQEAYVRTSLSLEERINAEQERMLKAIGPYRDKNVNPEQQPYQPNQQRFPGNQQQPDQPKFVIQDRPNDTYVNTQVTQPPIPSPYVNTSNHNYQNIGKFPPPQEPNRQNSRDRPPSETQFKQKLEKTAPPPPTKPKPKAKPINQQIEPVNQTPLQSQTQTQPPLRRDSEDVRRADTERLQMINQEISELESLMPRLTAQQEARLSNLRLEKEFQRRLAEAESQGDEDSDDERAERRVNREMLHQALRDDIEKTQQHIIDLYRQQRFREVELEKEHMERLNKRLRVYEEDQEHQRERQAKRQEVKRKQQEEVARKTREQREKQRAEFEENKKAMEREEERVRQKQEEEAAKRKEWEREKLREMQAAREAEENAIRAEARRKEEEASARRLEEQARQRKIQDRRVSVQDEIDRLDSSTDLPPPPPPEMGYPGDQPYQRQGSYPPAYPAPHFEGPQNPFQQPTYQPDTTAFQPQSYQQPPYQPPQQQPGYQPQYHDQPQSQAPYNQPQQQFNQQQPNQPFNQQQPNQPFNQQQPNQPFNQQQPNQPFNQRFNRPPSPPTPTSHNGPQQPAYPEPYSHNRDYGQQRPDINQQRPDPNQRPDPRSDPNTQRPDYPRSDLSRTDFNPQKPTTYTPNGGQYITQPPPPPPERNSSYEYTARHNRNSTHEPLNDYRSPSIPTSRSLQEITPKKSVSFNTQLETRNTYSTGTDDHSSTASSQRPSLTDSQSPMSNHRFSYSDGDNSDVFSSPMYTAADTPTVIGAQEIYRDPRARIESNKVVMRKPGPEKLSFKDKMKFFASEAGESTPKERPKSSRSQRDIESQIFNGN